MVGFFFLSQVTLRTRGCASFYIFLRLAYLYGLSVLSVLYGWYVTLRTDGQVVSGVDGWAFFV